MLVFAYYNFINFTVRLLCIAFLLPLLFSACGTKGPLYLPQDNAVSPESQND